MATKSNAFVIAFRNSNDNSVKYAGLDSRDSFVKNDNPMSIKKFFTKEKADELVRALRKKGLGEGITIRTKSLSQSLRDYAWYLIESSRDAATADDETMTKVLKRYEVKEEEASAETSEKKGKKKAISEDTVLETSVTETSDGPVVETVVLDAEEADLEAAA